MSFMKLSDFASRHLSIASFGTCMTLALALPVEGAVSPLVLPEAGTDFSVTRRHSTAPHGFHASSWQRTRQEGLNACLDGKQFIGYTTTGPLELYHTARDSRLAVCFVTGR